MFTRCASLIVPMGGAVLWRDRRYLGNAFHLCLFVDPGRANGF